jgi:hypothetical protein
MNSFNSVSNSSIDFFFLARMVRIIYCVTTICIAVPWGGRAASIQGTERGSLLLLLVLAVKKREVSGLSFLRRMRIEDRRNGTSQKL